MNSPISLATWPVLLVSVATLVAGCNAQSGGTNSAPVSAFTAKSDLPRTLPPDKPPTPPATVPENAWFTDITNGTGIDFRHVSGTNDEKPFPAANGSGIAALDYDRDGWCDLYFATGTTFPLEPGRRDPINRCYRNLSGNRFQDTTLLSGLGHNGYSAGIACGDYDGDGFPDVFVNCFGVNVLYRNAGDGTFEAVTESAGVGDPRWGTSAAFFDFDADGLLDLYVCHYAKWSWESRKWCGDRERNVRIHCSPHSVEPEADVLYRNLGDGSFADVTADAGLAERAGRAQGVIACDLDRDGDCDLYVGNDLNANSLFLNEGSGKFVDATELSGVGYDYKGTMQAGMGVDAADITGDGLPELFVTNFLNEHNAFYVNSPGNLFQDASQAWGLYAESLPWVGWGTAFADFDLDGALDLVVTNGHVDDNRHLLGEDAPYAEPALAWRQRRGRFQFLGAEAGEYFTKPHVGRALVVVDLDNDGDQDVVVGHQDGPPAILRNERIKEGGSDSAAITVQLVGLHGNRSAIGTVVTMRSGDRQFTQQVTGGGSYLSSHDPRRTFALAPDVSRTQLEILWPSGGKSLVDDLQPGTFEVIIEPNHPNDAPRRSVLR